jgi:mono/diheme cytochrome c family protein
MKAFNLSGSIFFAILLSIHSAPILAQVNYASQIQPIFNASCAGCHGGTSGVVMNSYNSVMSSVGEQYGRLIVTPGNADDSPLYDKLNPNPQFGSRMPQGGSLSEAQINLIRDWINQGANEVPATSIQRNTTPIAAALHQNYPNPFNPSTVIPFSLSEASFVEIGVYTVSGREVAKLTNRNYAVGDHSVVFDASGLSSGVYVYRLQSEGRTISRTMMLMR